MAAPTRNPVVQGKEEMRRKEVGILKRGYLSILLIKEKDTEKRISGGKWRDQGKNKLQRDHS